MINNLMSTQCNKALLESKLDTQQLGLLDMRLQIHNITLCDDTVYNVLCVMTLSYDGIYYIILCDDSVYNVLCVMTLSYDGIYYIILCDDSVYNVLCVMTLSYDGIYLYNTV